MYQTIVTAWLFMVVYLGVPWLEPNVATKIWEVESLKVGYEDGNLNMWTIPNH